MTTQNNNNSQMHNDIMVAGSKDRPSMLATGRYEQVPVPAKPTTETDPPVPEHTVRETYDNTLPENRAYIDAEDEAIHMILSGIGDEIYSTVNACKTAQEMWPAIERPQQDDRNPEQAQRDKDMQKSITLISKYFTKIYKPTNNNLITLSNSRNKNMYSTSRTESDRYTRQFGNQRTVIVAGARETVGN
ncbi:hypothetical protein Tco_1095065 [Tanacetum coccineum]